MTRRLLSDCLRFCRQGLLFALIDGLGVAWCHISGGLVLRRGRRWYSHKYWGGGWGLQTHHPTCTRRIESAFDGQKPWMAGDGGWGGEERAGPVGKRNAWVTDVVRPMDEFVDPN